MSLMDDIKGVERAIAKAQQQAASPEYNRKQHELLSQQAQDMYRNELAQEQLANYEQQSAQAEPLFKPFAPVPEIPMAEPAPVEEDSSWGDELAYNQKLFSTSLPETVAAGSRVINRGSMEAKKLLEEAQQPDASLATKLDALMSARYGAIGLAKDWITADNDEEVQQAFAKAAAHQGYEGDKKDLEQAIAVSDLIKEERQAALPSGHRGLFKQALSGVSGSAVPTLTGVTAGVLTRNPSIGAGFMVGDASTKSAAHGLDEGLSYTNALIYGAEQGAVEGLTEKFALSKLLKSFKGGGKEAIAAVVSDMGSEAVASLGNTLVDLQFGLDKEMQGAIDRGDWGEVAAIQGERSLIGALSGGLMSGTLVSTSAAARRAVETPEQRQQRQEAIAAARDWEKARKTEKRQRKTLEKEAKQQGISYEDLVAQKQVEAEQQTQPTQQTPQTPQTPSQEDVYMDLVDDAVQYQTTAELLNNQAEQTTAPVTQSATDLSTQAVQSQPNVDAVSQENRGVSQESTTQPTAPRSQQRSVEAKDGVINVNNQDYQVKYRVVEADDLSATTHKASNQFRDRDGRIASQQQIQSIAHNPDYKRLTESPVMDIGAPTLANDGTTVIAGNGRLAGLASAYNNGTADGYKSNLIADAQNLGLDANAVASMQKPVLVREFTEPVNVAEMAIASNEGQTLAMSSLENARADAQRLPPLSTLSAGSNGELNTASNGDFIRGFVANLPQAQQNALMDKGGVLSKEGEARLTNAVLYQAYGDSTALNRLVENTDAGRKNILNALTKIAPKVAQAKGRMADGTLPQTDISDDVVAVIEKIAQLSANETKVSDYLAQQGLFGAELSPTGQRLLAYLEANKNSGKAIFELFDRYYDKVLSQQNPQNGNLFGSAPVSSEQLFTESLNEQQQIGRPLGQTVSDSGSGQQQTRPVSTSTGRTGSGTDTTATATEPTAETQEVKTVVDNVAQQVEDLSEQITALEQVIEQDEQSQQSTQAPDSGAFSLPENIQPDPIERQAEVLQGEPVAVVEESQSNMPKKGGFKAITQWASNIFKRQNWKATNPILGDVELSEQSVRSSLAHGKLNPYKNLAFASVKDVIENGSLVRTDYTQGNEDSFYISAPVLINGNRNVVTVLAHRDTNTQRMYLHSVTLEKNLLMPQVSEAQEQSSRKQNSSPTSAGLLKPHTRNGVETVPDTSGSGQRKTTSADIHNILHKALTFNNHAQEDAEIRTDLEKQLTKEAADKVVIDRTGKSAGKHSEAAKGAEGWYTKGDKVYINPDNIHPLTDSKGREILSKSERIAFVAWHELGHRGVEVNRLWTAFENNLKKASHNPFVSQLAQAIQTDRAKRGMPIDEVTAVEEALVEINAAMNSGEMDALTAKWGVKAPFNANGVAPFYRRLVELLRQVVGYIKGSPKTQNSNQLNNTQLLELLQTITDGVTAPINASGKGVQFSIGKKARANYEAQIRKKNPNISEEHLQQSLDFLHELEDSKENTKAIKVAVKWLSTDAIRLPFAMENVRKAIALADKYKIDPMQFKSPMDIIDKYYVDVEYGKPVNPDSLNEFSNKRTVEIENTGKSVTIYDVEDSEAGQRAVTKILHHHLGYSNKENGSKSPWCLTTFTKRGNPTSSAENYWFNTYNSVGKKIAFKDGEPIAFMAHNRDYDGDLWWDLVDAASNTLPLPDGGYLLPDGSLFNKDRDARSFEEDLEQATRDVAAGLTSDQWKEILDDLYEHEFDNFDSFEHSGYLLSSTKKEHLQHNATPWQRQEIFRDFMIHGEMREAYSVDIDRRLEEIRFGGGYMDIKFSLPPTNAELENQIADTVKRYGGETAYKKAKADGKTKLNYFQWVQVRMPNFKRWFGDWEKPLKIEKLRQSKPIVITGKEVHPDGDFKQYKKNAMAIGKSIRDTFTNKDTGKKIQIVGSSIKEVLQHDYKNAEQLQSIAAIPNIIEEGVLIETLPNEDKTKRPDIEEYDYYVVGLNIGGVDYTVKAAVGVTKGGDLYYDHKLTQIEKGDLIAEADRITNPERQQKAAFDESELSSLPSRITNPVGDNTSPFNIDDKRLLSILQVGDVSKVTDPDTGEPMPMYHGTGTKITTFDPKFTGKGNDQFGSGYYFTSDKAEAERYQTAQLNNQDKLGGSDNPNVISAYLNIKNEVDIQGENLNEFTLNHAQAVEMIKSAPDLYDMDNSPLGDWFDIWSDGIQDYMIADVAENYVDIRVDNLENDFYADRSGEFREKLSEVTGYDGVKKVFNDKTHYVAFHPSQIKSAVSNNGEFGLDNDDIRFSLASGVGDLLNNKFNEGNSLKDSVIRKMADKFLPIKRLQNTIKQNSGKLNLDNDVYLAEERYQGKLGYDADIMEERYVKPLADTLAEYNLTQDEFDNFLIARHAEERNIEIAKRNDKYPDGGSGMKTAEAKKILAEFGNDPRREGLLKAAQIVDEMTTKRLQIATSAGLIDEDMAATWRSNYKHYVPLKGVAKDSPAAKSGNNIGKGFNISGKESKIALGRSTMAQSPSSQVVIDLSETLVRARKNEVGQHFKRLVEENPDPELWQIFTKENPDRYTVASTSGGEITANNNAAVPMHMMPDKYLAVKENGKQYYIKVNSKEIMNAMNNLTPDVGNIFIRTMSGFNRYLSAINTAYSPEFVISNFSRDIQTAYLNLNAEATRDDGKIKGKNIAGKVIKDLPKASKAIYHFDTNQDVGGDAAKWKQYYQEFQSDGAKTGFVTVKDIDQQQKAIRKLIERQDGTLKSRVIRGGQAIGKIVDSANGNIENMTRLSAYVNAREAGFDRRVAASLAKNMTVNFNRRGEWGTYLSAMYLFANASVQGTMNFVRTMGSLNGDGKLRWRNLNRAQKIALFMTGASYTLALYNRAMAGEDDDGESYYDKIPGWVKERNIVIMKGDGKGGYWKIPLPYGYNIFSVIGTSAESVQAGKTSIADGAWDATKAFAGSFSPIPLSDSDNALNFAIKNATPTIFKPVVELGLNENYMGSSIYNENFQFGVERPDAMLGRNATSEIYKQGAKWLNDISGGDAYTSGLFDLHPETFQYLVRTFTGGMGQFWGTKVVGSGTNLAAGVELDANDVPFLSKVNGEYTPYEDQDKYYKRRARIRQLALQVKEVGTGEMSEIDKKKVKFINNVKAVDKALKELRKVRNAVYAESRLSVKQRSEAIKNIEKRIAYIIDQFNGAYNDKVGVKN